MGLREARYLDPVAVRAAREESYRAECDSLKPFAAARKAEGV
jgi:hypothetical protein